MVERGDTPEGETPPSARDFDFALLFDERGIVAGLVAGFSVLLVDKVLLIDKVMETLPFYARALVLAALIAFAVATAWTFGLLAGADPAAPDAARRRFEVFRQDLLDGGTPAKTYNRWLGRLLDAVDRFFGDAGRDDPSRFARMLRLETPGPRWTAMAYDRCLLLALVYPIVVIAGVWAISGHVGPAEAALGLRPGASGWTLETARRWGWILSIGAACVASIGAMNAQGRAKTTLWLVAVVIFLGLFLVLSKGVAGAVALAVAVGFAFAVTGAFAFAVAGAGAGAVAFAVAVAGAFAFAVAFAVAVQILSYISRERGLMGPFLIGFSIVTIGLLWGMPLLSAPLSNWHDIGAIGLFFGLFTVVNAPIDWAALGFTRALLRKGLQKQGWWPFAFALVDLVIAAGLVALLAFALVFAVQVFDDMAVLGGGPGARILPIPRLLAELRTAPAAYEHWWVWAMLFSSMIPSFVNLIIASAAFLRGLPVVNAWILARLDTGAAVPLGRRLAISAVVSGQIALGALLGAAALVVFARLLLPMVFGPFAEALLSFSEFLADAELPARLLEILTTK